MSDFAAIVGAVSFSVLVGRVAYAQGDTSDYMKELVCSSAPGRCLTEPYYSKKWIACANEVAVDFKSKSMKITELASEGTRYGRLFTLLVSGIDNKGRTFRYTANCHVSKAGELIEFKEVQLR